MTTNRALHTVPRTLSCRVCVIPLLASLCLLAALIHGFILAFHRSFGFRDFDLHREVGRRFLSGEYLYANDFCYAYMPVAAMYFSPLALMGRDAGLMVRYVLALGCLVATVILFYRMTVPYESEGSRSNLYLLGGGSIRLVLQFILQELDDGGRHLILLGILSAAMYAVWQNRE